MPREYCAKKGCLKKVTGFVNTAQGRLLFCDVHKPDDLKPKSTRRSK